MMPQALHWTLTGACDLLHHDDESVISLGCHTAVTGAALGARVGRARARVIARRGGQQ